MLAGVVPREKGTHRVTQQHDGQAGMIGDDAPVQ
jgi:hypothetical protein